MNHRKPDPISQDLALTWPLQDLKIRDDLPDRKAGVRRSR